MYKRYKDVSLILKIVIGIVVGAVLGVLVPSWSFIDILGKLFVGALKAIAPLLVFLLIMSAISIPTRLEESLWHRDRALLKCHTAFVHCGGRGFLLSKRA